MMKSKISVIVLCIVSMLFVTNQKSYGQDILNQLKNAAVGIVSNSNSSTVSALINSVIGSSTISESDLVGTWKYAGADCAFTSENLLAKAGGEVASQAIEKKLNAAYSKAKLSSSNTVFTFNSDMTCTIKIAGKSFNGTYTVNTSKSKINIKGTIFSSTAYITKSGSNLSFLFDASKLLTLIQTIGKVSGNSQLTTISTLSKNYTGVKMGFVMNK